MDEPVERSVHVAGIRMRFVELGAGVPVVLCHGFPGLSYSYRRQMRAVADAGFRAIAPDMLGYGGTDAPTDPAEYDYANITAQLVALLDTLGAAKAVFVGHDFGAPAAWNVALRAPERVLGLVLLSVPYDPDRLPARPSSLYAQMAAKHFFHVHYFQAPGVADRELARDPRGFLHRLLWALSGGYRYLDVWSHPSEGRGYLDVLPEAPPLPWPWLSAAELDHYVDVFTKTGFSGGLAWYRAFDRNWETGGAYAGAKLTVPTMLIAGERDAVIEMRGMKAIDRMRAFVPDLRGVFLLPGVGHWVQQEAAGDVNRLLADFLRGLTPT